MTPFPGVCDNNFMCDFLSCNCQMVMELNGVGSITDLGHFMCICPWFVVCVCMYVCVCVCVCVCEHVYTYICMYV
jgi:hypothetical protein